MIQTTEIPLHPQVHLVQYFADQKWLDSKKSTWRKPEARGGDPGDLPTTAFFDHKTAANTANMNKHSLLNLSLLSGSLFLVLVCFVDVTAAQLKLSNCAVSQTNRCGIGYAVDEWIAGGTKRTNIVSLYGNIQDWDVSGCSTFTGLFQRKTTFNADISKVRQMRGQMFLFYYNYIF